MPVILQNREIYTIDSGATISFLKGNVGDQFTAEITVQSSIEVITGTANLITWEPITGVFTWAGGNFETEGFRIGDTIFASVYTPTGTLLSTDNATVTSVTAGVMDVNFSSTFDMPTLASGNILRIGVNTRKREGLILDINFSPNGQSPNPFSFIDGEITRYVANISALGMGQNMALTPVGNQSGSYIKYANISRNMDASAIYDYYTILIQGTIPGIYSEEPYLFADCLKLSVKMSWQSLIGEPSNLYVLNWSDDADTGWYNNGFNLQPAESVLVQGITALPFDSNSTHTIIIDSVEFPVPNPPKAGIGFSYCPLNELYYKNQLLSQGRYGIVRDTVMTSFYPNGWPQSYQGPSNEGYEIYINSHSVVANTHTLEIEFRPNPAFTAFFNTLPDGDRFAKLWIRIGNTNVLVYDAEMTFNPPVGEPLEMVTNVYFDHAENITAASGTMTTYYGNVEDDIAFYGEFLVPNDVVLTYFQAKIIAFNDTTDESFDLFNAFFEFSEIPVIDGIYPIDMEIPVISTLPNTSEKLTAVLKRKTSIDEADKYGMSILFPFLYRWEYWLEQMNADADFYPNEKTKNWVPFGNTGDWKLNVRLDLLQDGLANYFQQDIVIRNYDHNPNVSQSINLFLTDGTPVSAIIENQTIIVETLHTITDGGVWDTDSVWGMITVEPTESSPRWICSSVVAHDFNPNNPLAPITGNFAELTFVSPSIVKIRCTFNSNLINLQNGVKFTTKIKNCNNFRTF
jgi:hypothetical protein